MLADWARPECSGQLQDVAVTRFTSSQCDRHVACGHVACGHVACVAWHVASAILSGATAKRRIYACTVGGGDKRRKPKGRDLRGEDEDGWRGR